MSFYSSKLVVTLILLASLLSSSTTNIIASARNFDSKSTHHLTDYMNKSDNEEGPTSLSCWDALLELQSCSGEVVLFFMNGDTHMGPNCCNAIRTMQHHCWPSMLGSIGITTEESDILRGYCDAVVNGDGDGGSATSSPPPKEIVN